MSPSQSSRLAYLGLSCRLRPHLLPGPAAYDWGLSALQLHSLRMVAWLPRQNAISRAELQLGFADGTPLPHSVRLADGATLPIHAIRIAPGKMHGARIGNAVRNSGSGTLTGLLRGRENRGLYALTAGHVLAAAADTRIGDRISIWRQGGPVRDAILDHWMPGFFSGPRESRIDAGLARMDLAQAHELAEQDLQLPDGAVGINLQRLMEVRTCGDSAPVTAIPQGFASAWMELEGNTGVLDYQIIDAMVFAAGQQSLVAGDSGAPVMEGNRLAAMYIGSAPSGLLGVTGWAGLAVPMVRILDWCKADLVLSTADLATLEKPASQPASPIPAPAASTELTLARTIWGEARGEGQDGMTAVANVVMNRVKRPRYWGRNVDEVCLKPYQFSCWNQGDPNLRKLQKLNAPDLLQPLSLARAAIALQLPDITGGATHYYARNIPKPPRWAENHRPCAIIGNHIFYNDIA